MREIKYYGWLPDIPDRRDFLYAAVRPALRVPKTVDLRAYCSAVEDQGALGSCTANALAGNLEFLDEKASAGWTDVSRLFIYYNERAIEGTVSGDSGAMLRDGIKSLKTYGACPEAVWPYDISRFTVKPSKKCYADG